MNKKSADTGFGQSPVPNRPCSETALAFVATTYVREGREHAAPCGTRFAFKA